MIQRMESLSQMSERAVRLLVKELGVVDTARFLNQFRVGSGDYTRDRDSLFAGKTVDELAKEIHQWQLSQEKAPNRAPSD